MHQQLSFHVKSCLGQEIQGFDLRRKKKLRHEFPRIFIGPTGSAEREQANGKEVGGGKIFIRYAPGVCKSSGEDHAKPVRCLDITSLESAIKATTVRHRSRRQPDQ